MPGNQAVINRATRFVCDQAGEKFGVILRDENPIILLPAGYHIESDAMMNVLMRRYLLVRGFTAKELQMLQAPEFTTAGETVAVARYIAQWFAQEDVKIILVIRWWHARRAKSLLRLFLKGQGLRNGEDYTIEVVRVRSWNIFGMLREPFAWIKNLWRAKYGFKFKSESYYATGRRNH